MTRPAWLWLEELEPRCLPSTYYVAANGSNSAGAGGINDPFQTISFAATQATHAGDVIVVRQGAYHETVSGVHNGVTVEAFAGESVTVSGADPVTTAWAKSPLGSGIYQTGPVPILTPVPSTPAAFSPEMDQVFVDGQPMTEARWPNTPLGLTFTQPVYATAAAANAGAPFNCTPAAAPLPSSWMTCDETVQLDSPFPVPANATDAAIQISLGHHYWWQTGTVTAVTPAMNSLTFHFTEIINGTEAINAQTTFPANPTTNYLFLEGAGLLDSPGEWWLTPGTASNPQVGTLSLWTPQGDSPASHNVEVKARQFAFDLSGTQNVTIQGINIFAAGINTDGNTTGLALNGLNAQYIYQDTVVLNPYADGASNSGIALNGSNNVVENSNIAYSSGNGISLQGTNNSALYNVVRDTDYAGDDASTIGTGTGYPSLTMGGKIEYNTLYNTWREGTDFHTLVGGTVSYNNVSFAGLQTYDQGLAHSVGSTAVPNAQTEVAFNLLHDDMGQLGKGIYLDNNSSGYNVHDNVAWNVDSGMALNGQGSLNSVYNNTLVSAPGGNLVIYAPPQSGPPSQTNSLITNNLFDPGANLSVLMTSPSAGNTIADNFNVVPNDPSTDPLFVNPAANDYQLQPNSPALGTGYNQTFTSHTGFTSSPYAGAFNGMTNWSTFNHAPLLDNTHPLSLAPVAVGGPNPGTLVSAILASGGGNPITDVDPNAQPGIAIIGTNDSPGNWSFSTDGGTTWTPVAGASPTNALLLDAGPNTRVRFSPAAGQSGTIANGIVFCAWDGTSGSPGTYADTTANGGQTALSVMTAEAGITFASPPVTAPPAPPPPAPPNTISTASVHNQLLLQLFGLPAFGTPRGLSMLAGAFGVLYVLAARQSQQNAGALVGQEAAWLTDLVLGKATEANAAAAALAGNPLYSTSTGYALAAVEGEWLLAAVAQNV